jgi:hypothetical protein
LPRACARRVRVEGGPTLRRQRQCIVHPAASGREKRREGQRGSVRQTCFCDALRSGFRAWEEAGHHTAERSRDMIGGVVGLLSLLLALVLGLLIWTSFGVYNTQPTELQTIAARALEFDLEMRQYGPEADRSRELLRNDLV